MNNNLFKLAFQVGNRGMYHQLVIYPEAKVYTYGVEAERDMTLKYIDLDHYDDMIRMERALQSNGYKVRIVA